MKWLTGKKTYIGAGALAVVAVAGFWFGAIDATQLGEAIAVAFAIIGLGHKFDRQIASFVAVLEAAKQPKQDAASAPAAPAK